MDVRAKRWRARLPGDLGHSYSKSASPGRQRRKRCSTRRGRRWAENRLGYTDALGIAALREAIAGHYRTSTALPSTTGEIVVTTGSWPRTECQRIV